MSRTTLVRLCGGILFLLGSWVAYTQNPPAGQLTISKVKEDLYQIVGDGGNVAVYVTSEGVILVDDKFEQDYDQIVAKVKSVTPQPINASCSAGRSAISCACSCDRRSGRSRPS